MSPCHAPTGPEARDVSVHLHGLDLKLPGSGGRSTLQPRALANIRYALQATLEHSCGLCVLRCLPTSSDVLQRLSTPSGIFRHLSGSFPGCGSLEAPVFWIRKVLRLWAFYRYSASDFRNPTSQPTGHLSSAGMTSFMHELLELLATAPGPDDTMASTKPVLARCGRRDLSLGLL
jgi:hypothetical protein